MRIPSLSGSMPSASKTNGNVELLGAAFDEQHGTRKEELRTVAVELRQNTERLRLRKRLRLEERRAVIVRVPHEREILDAVDAEEDRRMRRVQDLVAALRELAQHVEQMPLEMRAQVQLRLLDEENEPAQVRREQRSIPATSCSPPPACDQ